MIENEEFEGLVKDLLDIAKKVCVQSRQVHLQNSLLIFMEQENKDARKDEMDKLVKKGEITFGYWMKTFR